ncbi:MAG: cytochrome P450 [Pseudomonadota bacterium]
MNSPAVEHQTFSELRQDPSDPAFFGDPYTHYANWHRQSGEHGPVFYWHHYNCWVFGGNDAVNSLFRTKKLGRRMPDASAPLGSQWRHKPDHLRDFYRAEEYSLLELEPPTHTRIRKLINSAFLARQIRDLSGDIATECDRLIDHFPRHRPVDLIQEFAEPLAVNTIARMLGVDPAHGPQLLAWSHAMVRMYLDGRTRRDEEAANVAARAFRDWLTDVVRDKQDRPDDALISQLVAAAADGDTLSTDEIISTIILLLNAGHEASVHGFGNGVRFLLEAKDDERRRWLSEADAFVEEVLRIAPPLHLFFRYVLEPTTLYGIRFEPGDRVGLHIGLANHDPRTIDEPTRFRPERTRVKNTAFGAGIHFCIGHSLARLELNLAFKTLFARLPNLQLAEPPQLKDAYHFHGFERLHVSWGPID